MTAYTDPSASVTQVVARNSKAAWCDTSPPHLAAGSARATPSLSARPTASGTCTRILFRWRVAVVVPYILAWPRRTRRRPTSSTLLYLVPQQWRDHADDRVGST